MNTVKAMTTALALLIAAGAAAAPAERPCRDDLMKYCQSAVGQREEMRQCIRTNYSQLSEQCQTALRERAQQRGTGGSGDRPPPAADPQPDTAD